MADKYLKNIVFEKALELSSLVSYQEGQIVSRTLAQNKAVSVTLFAFDAGEEISTHASHGDAMVTVLDGTARVTIGGTAYTVQAGQSIVMPAGAPHSVEAPTQFKMMLLVVFPAV
jgi:quercetin dioxygenase-like cupin family protein